MSAEKLLVLQPAAATLLTDYTEHVAMAVAVAVGKGREGEGCVMAPAGWTPLAALVRASFLHFTVVRIAVVGRVRVLVSV